MNNIKNTTKIILFASLIAALILPFSAMDFAEADDKGKKIQDKIKELKTNAENKKPKNQKDIDKNNKYIERLTIAEKLIALENAGKGDSNKANKLRIKLITELEKLPKSEMVYDDVAKDAGKGDTNDAKINAKLYGQKAYATSTNFDTSNIIRSDCGAGSWGDSHGYITSWFTHSQVIASLVSSTDYPSSITVNCSTKNFDDGYINFYDFSNPAGTCFTDFDSSNYIRSGYCDHMTIGHLVLINAQASYQGTSWGPVSYQWVIL